MEYPEYFVLATTTMRKLKSSMVNDQIKQQGDTKLMIHSIPDIIQYRSQTQELYPDDLIFTGTPSGIGPLMAGNTVQKNQ